MVSGSGSDTASGSGILYTSFFSAGAGLTSTFGVAYLGSSMTSGTVALLSTNLRLARRGSSSWIAASTLIGPGFLSSSNPELSLKLLFLLLTGLDSCIFLEGLMFLFGAEMEVLPSLLGELPARYWL